MQFIIRMFHRSDLSRSRALVQQIADDFIKDRRKLEETKRNAARALEDAKRVEERDFSMRFEKRLQPAPAFLPSIIPAGAHPTAVFDPRTDPERFRRAEAQRVEMVQNLRKRRAEEAARDATANRPDQRFITA